MTFYNLLSVLAGIEVLGIVILVLAFVAISITLGILIPLYVIGEKYKRFVAEHSVSLRKINEINKSFKFKGIPNCDLYHSYDNESFFTDISCADYLTYQLVYTRKKVDQALKDTLDNHNLYIVYKNRVNEECILDQYDTEELLKNRDRLRRTERRLFNGVVLRPITEFSITVKLTLTRINGRYRGSKTKVFSPKEIKDIIFKLNQKKGSFYLNEEVWHSICRVERGKVTNKMRFAVYQRDRYRCRMCGSKNNLEVDHIFPIAKGGKTTFNNL